jgi:hypothetical protein
MKACEVKILKKIKRYFLCKNGIVRSLYILYVKRMLVKLQRDEVGVICALNLGETYLFCAMLDSFKIKNNIEKVVLISERKYHADVFEMFSDKMHRYCVSTRMYARPFRAFREIKAGSLYFMYDHTNWHFTSLAQSETTHLQQLKITAGIDSTAAIQHHENKEIYKTKAKELFKKLDLKQNKTVLVSPEAKSCEPLDETFYQRICHSLKSKGYDIFLNSTSSNNNVSYAKSTFLPLAIATPFCDLCGHVVAIRSGFCDVISNTKARLHIIYPNQCFQKVFPIKDIATSNYIKEYIMDKTTKEDLIKSIIANI